MQAFVSSASREPRLNLRLLRTEDLAVRVEWLLRPEVYRFMHFNSPITLESTLKWHEKNVNDKSRCDILFLTIDNKPVAMGGLTKINSRTKNAELYIFVNPDEGGKNYGTESTYLLCEYGFRVLKLHKIYLFVNAGNIAARKVYEKVGFKVEGILREETIFEGAYEDRFFYGMLSSELKNVFV